MAEQRHEKPHVVCIPYPAQGHINPMLKLAKLFHSSRANFHVTFVNTHYNHRRLLRANGPDSLSGLPSFRFESIDDGLPGPVDANVTQDSHALCEAIETNCAKPFRELLDRLNDTASSGVPPVTCIISDALMYFSLDVAEQIEVPNVVFCAAGAWCFMCYAQFDKLIEKDIVPFKDHSYATNGELDMVLNWLPGASELRLRDFPSFIRITDRNDYIFNFTVRFMNSLKKASAVLFNSFEVFEHDVLQYLPSNTFPLLYTIGPLQLMLDRIDEDTKTKSIKSNLWKEDPYCLMWLNSHGPNSVVYVNFGSITVMTNSQLAEFAWGLANSKQPFLWIARPDLVVGETAILPPEFLEEIKGRGLITSWCDQEIVLAHPAVGVFLTHCGWNSTLESVCNGVPMICWPFFADQQTNCWNSCKKWGIGIEIDSNVKKDEVERQVNKLMEGDKGKDMRRKALEWKNLAQEATLASGGSSYSNFDNIIKMLSLNQLK